MRRTVDTRNLLVKSAIAALALATAVTSSYGQKQWNAPHIVTAYCSGCHGIDGNAQLPYIPKLAGLDATYTGKKLMAFTDPPSPPVDELYADAMKAIDGRKDKTNLTRNEQINMEGVAHAAKRELLQEALLWYARQTPVSARHSHGLAIQQGEKLFKVGVPAQKIVPCMTCHGPNAEGQREAPRLAAQNAEYIEMQLAKFRKGDRTHAPEMTMVTRDLDSDQAHAVALYLQSR